MLSKSITNPLQSLICGLNKFGNTKIYWYAALTSDLTVRVGSLECVYPPDDIPVFGDNGIIITTGVILTATAIPSITTTNKLTIDIYCTFLESIEGKLETIMKNVTDSLNYITLSYIGEVGLHLEKCVDGASEWYDYPLVATVGQEYHIQAYLKSDKSLSIKVDGVSI